MSSLSSRLAELVLILPSLASGRVHVRFLPTRQTSMVSFDFPRSSSTPPFLCASSSQADPCFSLFPPPLARPLTQIYLNDTFSNGCTTFFLPSPTPGTLNAFPVKPSTGCALVFPHGDSKGSLLHEGSPVGEGGAKYVIRTEVLYRAKAGIKGGLGKEGEKDEGVEV